MGTVDLDAPPTVDFDDCHDIFVTGLVRIDRLGGGMFRFVFGVEEADERGNKRVRVVDRQVWHTSKIPKALRLTGQALAAEPLMLDDEEASLALPN